MRLLKKKVWTPTFEEFKKRKDSLAEILRKQGCLKLEASSTVLRIRHQIQNAQHEGYFLDYCCDDCYAELYCEDPLLPDQLICPGCGWESAVSDSAVG